MTGRSKRGGATLVNESPEPASPACWRWKPITDVTIWRLLVWSPETWTRMDKRQQQWVLMREWHRGRCAVCGRRGVRLVEDHSHETGLTRGFLCQSCNVREGYRWGGVYQKYRERNPASMLALQFPYVDPVTGIAAEPKPTPAADPAA